MANVNPTFLIPDHHTPRVTDARWFILQKILGALIDNGSGGGGGSGQMVSYTSGSPAAPSDISQPALAYDPNGILPTLGWNTVAHTWG